VSSISTYLVEQFYGSPRGGRRYYLYTNAHQIWQSADGQKNGALHIERLRLEKLPWGPKPNTAKLGLAHRAGLWAAHRG
jgi:hypothetical protein